MNEYCYDYVKAVLLKYPVKGRVLEVGSYNVNGTVRDLFANKGRFPSYVGVDIRQGPDVDAVMAANALDFPDRSFETVVCCETMEHDNRVWESVREFHRVLKSGGFLIVTTRNIGFHRHDYPSDYWRFTREGLGALMEYAGLKPLNLYDSLIDNGTFGTATKLEAENV